MKKFILILFISLSILSCKKESKTVPLTNWELFGDIGQQSLVKRLFYVVIINDGSFSVPAGTELLKELKNQSDISDINMKFSSALSVKSNITIDKNGNFVLEEYGTNGIIFKSNGISYYDKVGRLVIPYLSKTDTINIMDNYSYEKIPMIKSYGYRSYHASKTDSKKKYFILSTYNRPE
jgi:hypothetical protein